MSTWFENVQAGQRPSHLFRLANQNGGLVVGTSDLPERGRSNRLVGAMRRDSKQRLVKSSSHVGEL